MAIVTNQTIYTGTVDDDSIGGTTGNDSLAGSAANDTLQGGPGNDTVDGGSGYNTYVVTGSADAYYWSVNANGEVILTDAVIDAADTVDGSDEGVDTLKNIQLIEYRRPDGTVESTFQLDDFGNAADVGNTKIQYGVWVTGRANFYGDLDYFKLDTVSGQKVLLSGANGSGYGYLSESGDQYSIQGQNSYVSSGNDRTLTWNATGTTDVRWRSNELSSTSPMASKGYGFILRRELDGTDAADTLTAGNNYEYLVGGLGNDTLTGSARSDSLSGGDGNDVITGGAGNDELDGGAGTANVAVYSGNAADYTTTWTGSNLSLTLTDKVAGRDGTDQLTNVQILRFADGDVVLDAESNVPTAAGAVAIGQAFSGSLPITPNGQSSNVDIDYYQQKLAADVSTSTALRLTITTRGEASVWGGGYIYFYYNGTQDRLTFTNLGSSGTINQFSFSFQNGERETSWIVSPLRWGSASDFVATAQRADVQVSGYVQSNTAELGDAVDYSIRLDRVLFGTTGADTLVGDGIAGYIDARDGHDSVTGSAIDEQIVGGAGDDSLAGGAGDDTLVDGSGVNVLNGGAGDDVIDISAAGSAIPPTMTAATMTIEGGDGTDTLKVDSDMAWTGLTVSGVEVLDGGRTSLTPDQILAKGFTTVQNTTLRLDTNLATGGTLDASGLSGNLNLRGTNQSDTLVGNAGNNTIYLNSDEKIGPGYGVDHVQAGAGDDTITLLENIYFPSWNQIFSASDSETKTYFLNGDIDGGVGYDTLRLEFTERWFHPWGGYSYENAYTLDMTNANLTGIEKFELVQNSGYGPATISLTADQIGQIGAFSGKFETHIHGGGLINLDHFANSGLTGLGAYAISDSASYEVIGTANADIFNVGSGVFVAALNAGNDEIIIDSKPLVTDVLDGGAGTDTLTIRGTDVDLSGATLSNFEAIKVSAQSLSMTDTQWQALGSIVTRVSGANTGYILSVTTPGTTTLAVDSAYVGLTGSTGDDRLAGNATDNILVGGDGNDTLVGNAGKDRLVTGAGVDSVSGGEGDDTLVVSGKTTVRDILSGDAGTDTLQVSDGQDLTAATISGVEVLKGSGTVTMSAAQLAGFSEIQGVTVQLSGESTTFALDGVKVGAGAAVKLADADPLITVTSGAVIGSKGDDTITGGNNNDLLMGGRGSDFIDGGAGNDTLQGGASTDILVGGAGNDQFEVASSEFSSATSGQVELGGTQLDWKSRIVYSDQIDAGEGSDTLRVDFSNDWDSAFVFQPGAVSNLESLDVRFTGGSPWLYLTADSFAAIDQISLVETDNGTYRTEWANLVIYGVGQDIALANLSADSDIRSLALKGSYRDIDARAITIGMVPGSTEWWNNKEYLYISVSAFDSIALGDGADTLRVEGDGAFSATGGAGDDYFDIRSVHTLTAAIDAGTGTDTLDLSSSSFIDISRATLTGIETVKFGSSTIVVSDTQFDALSFDGSGKRFTRTGDTIVGSAGNDSYSGDGTGSFQGGKGDDSISNVNTAVFAGNLADYDITRSGATLTVEQSRGTMTDGKDTLTGVMNLKFADVTVPKDDAPNDTWLYRSEPAYGSLTLAEYGKRVSAKKDYASDTDVFAATFAPNSPLAIEASTNNGSGWWMEFVDVATGQSLQFKSLVYGQINWSYYNWMSADAKWLPGFNTADGFKAYAGGDVVFRVQVNGDKIEDYAFTLNYLDDYAGSVDTLGQMDAQTGVIKGYIGDIGDADWIRTDLIAGTKYEFHLNGVASGGGSLVDPKLQLMDAAGRLVESGFDLEVDKVGNDDALIYRPPASGSYYLAVTDVAGISKGSWTLTQQSLDTIAGNTSTTERIEWSGADTFTVSSEINILSDHDWFRVWLDKGITYELRALGSSQGGTLSDPQLSIRSATGILLGQDDNSGGGSDAKLAYSAPDSGWYYLDAGASGNASKGTYILKGKTLADDFSNDRLTTGVVEVGTPLQGLITYNGDSDWIKVGLSKGQVYVIDLVGDISDSAQLDPLVDPLLIVHDKDGEIIARYDDFSGSLNSRAYFTPTVDGLYYLEAKSAFKYDIGAYQLTVALAPPDDFAEAMNATAAALVLGTARQGEIGIPGDRDVFKVSLEAGKIYQVSVNGLANHDGTLVDPYLRVFDGQGRLVDFDNNGSLGNDAELYLEVATSGTYYIEASSNKDRGMGTYEVAVVQRALPADEAPGNVGTTVFLNPGDSFSGHLLTHNDQDWFGIRLEAGKDYIFKLQASHSGNGTLADPVLELHAADGTTLIAKDNMLISNEPAFVYTPTAAGTYYLAVKAADGANDVGSYTLVTRTPDDYSNTKPGAQAIVLDQVVEGAIQYSDGAYGVRAYDSIGLATDSDEDWFQFTATAGQVLSVNVEIATGSALSRPMVEVVDANNRSMAVGDGLETLNGRAVATFKAVEAGTYFARVIDGAGATGAYTLTLTAGDASDEDAQAPVMLNFVNQGSILQAEAKAKIGLSGDTDTFTVALQEGHSYRIETLAVRDGVLAPLGSAKLDLAWLAQGGTTATAIEVGGEMATPSFFDATDFAASTSGTMTIAVAPLDATQTGQYKLRVIDLGVAQPDDHPDRVVDYVDASDVLAGNDNADGRIDSADDVDLYAINLTASNIYDFSVKSYADGLGTLAQAELRLLDSNGLLVTSGAFDGESGRTELAVSVFADGRYYLAVSAADLPGNTGTFALDTRLRGADEREDDIRADAQSGVTAGPGRTAAGKIDYAGDHDWIRATLSAGKVYVLDVLADGDGAGGTLKDATLRLLDSDGNEIAFDDDSGAGLDAHIQFTAAVDGDYHLDVGSNGTDTGTYTVRVRELYSGIADPLKSAQWYLSALGLDALNGQITGAGVTVGMIDDGIDTAHPDLQKQIDFALSYDTVYNTQDGKNKIPYPTSPLGDFHGTAVAGIIVSEQNNETGIVGVAPDAEIASTRVKWSWDQITQALGLQWQFDVSNNSWGAIDPFADNFNSTTLTFAYQALRTGFEDGRDGLGTVFVFSAGNSSGYGDNTNYHNFQNAREVITVAATNADGSVASFSTPGASVLVGAYGVDLLTTDRHEKGLGLNTNGNYTSFSGTSAAAPVVAGVVALMLEANPDLGYRDVQEILAYSAWHPDNQDWKTNGAANFNLGGLQFNDQTGFGVVDAYSAVRLAATWTEQSTAINEISASARKFGLVDAIPDGDGTTYTRSFTIDANLLVEHVELGIDLRHTRLGDLVIELISPTGTVSTLMNRPTVNEEQPFGLSGTDSGVPTHLLWDFSSVQFWGEEASGNWTVNVKDVRAEETGTLQSLSLRVYGERDDGNDTYVFTDEGFVVSANRVLSDETGIDTINASPLGYDLYVNLGAEHLIAANGVTYAIDDWSVIENAITGSGDDRLDGNDTANLLNGMEGDDILTGGLGNDTLMGGAGSDVAYYAGNRADYTQSWNPDSKTLTIIDNKTSDGNEGTDVLTGIERIVFADAELNLSSSVGNRAPVMNARVFDTPVLVQAGVGIDYGLPLEMLFDPDEVPTETIVVEAPKNPAAPDEPVYLDTDAGGIRFGLLYVNPYDPTGDVAIAEVSFELMEGVSSFVLETENVLLDDLDADFGQYEFQVNWQTGVVTSVVRDRGAVDVVFNGLNGRTLTVDLRINPEHDLPPAGVDTMDILLSYEDGNTVEGKTEVNLVSSAFGLYDLLKGKNVSLEKLTVSAQSEAGGELPEWLAFDPQTLKFTGVPPQDYQGQLKILITATDEFGEAASDVLTLEFGDNQAPVLETARELVVQEDAGLVPLGITLPTDPEGKGVTVTVLDIPSAGHLLDKQGNALAVGASLSADELTELTYQTATDVFGDAGYVRYQAKDEDGVTAESSVHLFVDAVNDAPRFANAGSKLTVKYPLSEPAPLDLLVPTDPESILEWVKVTALPELGRVLLDGSHQLQINQTLSLAQLKQLTFTLSENVNGPIGGITLQASDAQGLATEWTLAIEVQGDVASTTGTSGNDALYGSTGADTLYGASGNDILVGNAGKDRLLGGLGNDSLFGGSGNDLLDGSAGNDYLDGGLGDDTLNGGPGADTYIVDSAADLVLEILSGGAGGKDLIVTSVSLTAPENVESIQAEANLDIHLTGNALDNILVGNELANHLVGNAGRDTLSGGAGNDTLEGGQGVDRMAGGAGDDAYYVDSRLDVAGELANEGVDTVYAKSSYTLASNVENLTLEEEAGNATAGGNSLANRLVGNSGNNVLAGGLGADTLEGGLGDDVYVLGDSLDTLIDTGGTDTIRSTLDVLLPTGFERIELAGIGDTTAIGNAVDNALLGNMGDNILEGGAGVDTLTGGAGSDQFMLAYNGAGKEADQITDFQSTVDLLVVDLTSLGLSASALGLLASGTVAHDALVKGAGAKAIDPGDYYLYDTARNVLKFDADGSGPGAAVDLVKLVGVNGDGLLPSDIYIAA